MLKKIGSIILILVFCLQTIVGSGFIAYATGASSDPNAIPSGDTLLVVGHKITKGSNSYNGTLYKDDEFKLEQLTILNRSNKKIKIENIFIEQNPSFFVNNGTIKISGDKYIEKGTTEPIGFTSENIKYGGGSGTLSIVIGYKLVNEDNTLIENLETFRTQLNINTGGEPPVIEVPEQKPGIPLLQVEAGRMAEGKAGEEVTVRLSFENIGTEWARNVSITPILDGNHFDIAEGSITKNISEIRDRRSASVSYRFQISDNAKMGTYPVKFNINYSNEDKEGPIPIPIETIAYIRVTGQNAPVRIQVMDASFNPQQANAGGEVRLGMAIKNIGQLTAKQVKVTLEGLGTDGFTLAEGTPTHYLPDLASNKATYVGYRFKVSPKIKGETQELTLKIFYQDQGGEFREEEHKLYIPINEGEKKESLLAIENVVAPEGSIRAGQDFSFDFDLVNLGKADARNIKISVGAMESGMIVPKSSSVRIVPELEGESSQRFNFIMTPSREAATQNYPIEITVTYQDEEVVDGKRETHTVNQYVGVYVVNPKKDAEEEETSKTVPKIIIDEYTLEPGIVKAGENFKLTTTFLNTSSQKSVQNVKISLVVVETSEKTGTVFTPVQSSNTFYIDHIAPKQKATKEIMLYTIPDAQAKTYTITVKFNYEDEKGEVFSEEDLIGIPVVQPSRIELGQIQFQGEAMEGQPLGVYVELYNTGKVMLNNLMIRMESEDFDITDSNLFVGNFQQGATEYYDRAMIIPRQPGKATGKLILTYEDPTGEELIKEEEFSIEVMEMFIPPMDEEWDMPMEEPKASLVKRIFTNKYLWMGLILAGFITAGLIVRKRRKVQEGLDLDE